jgi:ubiquinone/menaquinone biosynthesis C-methylase UbiE
MPDNILPASIETVAAYWNSRPCNLRHSKQPVGTKEYFQEVEKRKYLVEPHISQFAEFSKWKGKRVLEVGCGLGTDTINFARAGAEVTAVDLSEESLALAIKRAHLFGLQDQISFYLANAEELTKHIPAEKYDLVYSFGVLHHTPHPLRAISEIKQFMNDSSELRVMLYAKNSWKNAMIKAGLDQPEAQSGCPVAFTYSEDDVRSLLSGFKIIDIRQDHIFPFVIDKYIKHEYEIVPWFAAMPREMFKSIETQLGWHMMIRANLKI